MHRQIWPPPHLKTPSTTMRIFFHGRCVRGWPSHTASRSLCSKSFISATHHKIHHVCRTSYVCNTKSVMSLTNISHVCYTSQNLSYLPHITTSVITKSVMSVTHCICYVCHTSECLSCLPQTCVMSTTHTHKHTYISVMSVTHHNCHVCHKHLSCLSKIITYAGRPTAG